MDKKLSSDIQELIKTIFYILICVAVLIAFNSEIESFFESDFFSWFYAVKSSGWLDFFIILLSCLYLSIKINECKTEIPNDKITFLLILLLGFYTYERLFNSFFSFTFFHFKPLSKIAYLDILYLVLFLQVSNYLKNLIPFESNSNKKNQLLEDLPLENKNDDELDGLFEVSAIKIVKIIRNNKFRNSFTIGLNGEWGDGKTSVFNIVKTTLKDDDVIIIDFNPWMGFDKKVLIRDFFNSLSEGLNTNISAEITKYVEEILNNGEESGIINFIKSLVTNDESINSIFTSINKRIKLLDKKIIIFIDDVDRLDKEEIFELLKLIRKTANFHNMFFVVAYDRTYVNESIKSQSSETTIKYLDKIINVEINLPYFDKFILKGYFLEQLEKMVHNDLKYKIDYFRKRYEKDPLILDLGFDENDLFIYWLSNFREIKKVLNSLQVNYNHMYKEINFHDAIHLEILKLKHPYLYRLIFTKSTEIFGINSNANCYVFSPIDEIKAREKRFQAFRDRNKVQNANEERSLTVFEFYVDDYCLKNNINDIEKEKISDLIKRLFPTESSTGLGYDVDDKSREGYLSVRYVSKFERYFSHAVFSSNITEKDFDKFLLLNPTDIVNNLENWISENKTKDISWRLNRFDTFDNGHIYRNVLIASYHLLYLKISGNLLDYNVFIKKFVDQDFENLFGSLENAKQFYKELLTDVECESLSKSSTILFELLVRNRKRTPRNFPLSAEEIKSILKNNVQIYLQQGISFVDSFWNIYYKSLDTDEGGKKKPDNSTINLIKASLSTTDRKEDFIKSLIIGYSFEGFTLRTDDIINIFDSYEEFEKFIFVDGITSEIINEFKNFYNAIKGNNWDAIDFNFEKINIQHLD